MMKEFILAHYAASALKETPMNQRLERYQAVLFYDEGLTFQKVLAVQPAVCEKRLSQTGMEKSWR